MIANTLSLALAYDRQPAPAAGHEPQELVLYTEDDVPWIAAIVDVVEASVGLPWRVLRERLEHVTYRDLPIRATRVATILAALRRVMGGRAERARVARRLRSLVLGHPALDASARTDRLLAAGHELGLGSAEVEELLWVDLAEERPVSLPGGRPTEHRLAAFANLDRIQRAVRRAHAVRLTVWGDAHQLIRTAARYGLLATVTTRATGAGPAVVLDIVGPLSLFHATSVYGRALASLVPLLAGLPRYVLAVQAAPARDTPSVRVVPPVLLPPVPGPRGAPSLAVRLARELRKVAPAVGVELDPAPIAHGSDLLFPELALDHAGRRWWIEIVGFATAAYLAARLARYAAAGVTNLIVCVDEKRALADVTERSGSPDSTQQETGQHTGRAQVSAHTEVSGPALRRGDPPRPRILAFRGRPSAAAVLSLVEAPS